MANPPSDTTPAFTTERLRSVANEIVLVRRDARLEHRAEKGDTGWGYGCRCYERSCFALEGLTSFHPWLKVNRAQLTCTMFIEDEPVKFYRGDPNRPSQRSLSGAIAEALQQHQLFDDDVLNPGQSEWFWLMVIVQDHVDSEPQIAMLQADREGHTRELWFVPIDEPIPVVTSASAPEREGVELDPPAVGPKVQTTKEKTADGSDENEDGRA